VKGAADKGSLALDRIQSSSTQVSLVPPPWLELTTSEPSSAPRASARRARCGSGETSTKGLQVDMARRQPLGEIGQVDSASVGWAM
jgi:hypothetical protein